MFKLKFTADNSKIKKEFQKLGKSKYGKLLSSDGFWLQESKPKELREVGVILNRLDDVDAEIVVFDNVKFGHDDILKKVFLLDLSSKWEVEQSMRYAISSLSSIEDFENEKGKSLLYFTPAEAEEFAAKSFDNLRYYSLRFKVNLFSKLQEFYKDNLDLENNQTSWKDLTKTSSLKDALKSDNEVVTRDELVSLFNIMPNMQDSIIPLLIFEGASLSRVEEDDEIRYIEHGDAQSGKLKLTAGGYEKEKRYIDIDSDLENMINKVAAQKYMIRLRYHETELVDLADTNYLLKPMTGTKSRNDNKDSISFRGVYGRFLNCKEQFEANINHKQFTATSIEQSGKAHYVNKYINDGLELPDALRKTCKRFGDWTYLEDESKENGLQANRQRVARLKKIWEVYDGRVSSKKQA